MDDEGFNSFVFGESSHLIRSDSEQIGLSEVGNTQPEYEEENSKDPTLVLLNLPSCLAQVVTVVDVAVVAVVAASAAAHLSKS